MTDRIEKLRIYTHPSGILHDMGDGHPELPQRLQVLNALFADDYAAHLDTAIAPADPALFKAIHAPAYIDTLAAATAALEGAQDRLPIGAEAVMNAATWSAIRHGAGAALKAVSDIASGTVRNAFCAMRPPGHHAEYDRAMGFCFVNHAFLAAAQCAAKGQKAAIIDFDVHHGNGTADLTRRRAETGLRDILYVSTHEHPLYPGTGLPAREGDARGMVLDLPFPPYTGHTAFLDLYHDAVVPALARFRPDMLILSAGFDAHRDDPLSTAALTEDSFAALTALLAGLGLPVLSVLEGGYNLEALENSVQAHLDALLAA